MRSAVPLPCFFDVAKSQGVAGQRLSVRPSIRPPLTGPQTLVAGPQTCPAGPLAKSEGRRLMGSTTLAKSMESPTNANISVKI